MTSFSFQDLKLRAIKAADKQMIHVVNCLNWLLDSLVSHIIKIINKKSNS